METDSNTEANVTQPATPVTTPPETTADTGKGNTGDENKPLDITQAHLDKIMAERAGQAKRNAIGDLLTALNVPNVEALQTMADEHKVAQEKRKEEEEAAKSELQKVTDAFTASTNELTTLKTTTGGAIKVLLVKNAIMRRAPEKGVEAALFDDLLTLMDTSTIAITDGVVSDEEVDKAIDKTLEGRDYMKVAPANPGRGNGSPSRRSTPPKTPGTPEPVKRNRNASM